jgi:hypothetical protein
LKSGVSAAKEEEDDSDAASVADFEAEEFIAGDVSNLSPPLAYTTAAIEEREGGGGGPITCSKNELVKLDWKARITKLVVRSLSVACFRFFILTAGKYW